MTTTQTNRFTTQILHADRRGGAEQGASHKPIHSSVQYGYERVEDLIAAINEFLAAWNDDFVHVGPWTLGILGILCALAIAADVISSLLGAKRVGASAWALFGAAVGTLVGFFFSLPGLILGPFVGALAGELIAGSPLKRAAHVGLGTWLGMLVGTLVKVALAFAMIGVFALALLVTSSGTA